ncbi:cupin domain-containing protein [Planctomicrobium sp. SH527]|uniref:cupin domain-containing protein n=1 Tax=Planctomicrobium sp. SH527 TaxID=3448123 RepID=UPI003F5B921C
MLLTLQPISPSLLHVSDDGRYPNSKFPVLVYRQAISPIDEHELAELFKLRFSSNDWTPFSQNSILPYHHYHSTSHKVIGVAAGSADLLIGGPRHGEELQIATGDAVVIPAGVPLRCMDSSSKFKIAGAYSNGREADILKGALSDRPAADRRIKEIPLPGIDPLYGKYGPITDLWATCQEHLK